MGERWILVADSARARLFTMTGKERALVEHEVLVHPESRMGDRELASDRPGRTFDSSGAGRHAKQPPHDPKQKEAIEFSKELARKLEEHRAKTGVESIYLVAPPQFLGLLRDALTENCCKLVVQTLAKDLTRESADQIRQYVIDAGAAT